MCSQWVNRLLKKGATSGAAPLVVAPGAYNKTQGGYVMI